MSLVSWLVSASPAVAVGYEVTTRGLASDPCVCIVVSQLRSAIDNQKSGLQDQSNSPPWLFLPSWFSYIASI